jgi:hypothetical protein
MNLIISRIELFSQKSLGNKHLKRKKIYVVGCIIFSSKKKVFFSIAQMVQLGLFPHP